jgi:hypothetical protein
MALMDNENALAAAQYACSGVTWKVHEEVNGLTILESIGGDNVTPVTIPFPPGVTEFFAVAVGYGGFGGELAGGGGGEATGLVQLNEAIQIAGQVTAIVPQSDEVGKPSSTQRNTTLRNGSTIILTSRPGENAAGDTAGASGNENLGGGGVVQGTGSPGGGGVFFFGAGGGGGSNAPDGDGGPASFSAPGNGGEGNNNLNVTGFGSTRSGLVFGAGGDGGGTGQAPVSDTVPVAVPTHFPSGKGPQPSFIIGGGEGGGGGNGVALSGQRGAPGKIVVWFLGPFPHPLLSPLPSFTRYGRARVTDTVCLRSDNITLGDVILIVTRVGGADNRVGFIQSANPKAFQVASWMFNNPTQVTTGDVVYARTVGLPEQILARCLQNSSPFLSARLLAAGVPQLAVISRTALFQIV